MAEMSADQGRGGGAVERDIEQAITALKKGAYLLKYGRRGKPKFCPFRLSNDESILIWFSGKDEKHLRLSHVSRIMPGQRTAIFQRYPQPEKECQSFSLIYSHRSLDLICKDKDEAEVWFAGLKTLISRCHHRIWRTESRSDGVSSGITSPRINTRRSTPISSPFGSSESMQKDGSDPFRSPYGSPPQNGLDKSFSDVLYAVPPKGFFPSHSVTRSVHSLSSGYSDSVNGNMRGATMDAFRVSLSSAVSSSSQGSGHDDGDALGDVYIWGEGTGDGILGGGSNKGGSCSPCKVDSLVPKALESAVILDVQNISCGGRHAALVTKQGEVYSWGEESGGRLGHGVDSDVSQPKLIDSLANMNIELVACGEYHSCAVTLSGDLYMWGNGNSGILGHGNEVSHWVPKRVNGPLEGIHVSSISCGTWHTAVVTSSGQLFTFGDGTFGVLGHGDRRSVSIPREVESLKGLRTVRTACSVWHTAAIVEVMLGNLSSSNCSSGKLFIWGDGDKGRLGHGDKEPKLVPTCVAALVEPNFCQVACGHSMTAALTTSGHVYTMGSTVYGQLGNPQADGKLPVRVEGKLLKNFVEEISCGAYHVSVLTSRTEVYTWGKGSNGRLGHGDANDRNVPTLVDALKDKQVRSIVCGANFTAALCIHKWVSGVDQSICSGCRQPFNFKRKRHNCYNCALVYCHSCSSNKSLKASMAPNHNKAYRVCDGCFNKLGKALKADSSSHSSHNRKGSVVQGFSEIVEKDEKFDSKSQVQMSRYSSMESFKHMEGISKKSKKFEFNSSRVSPIPNGNSNGGALNISKSLNPLFGSSKKFFSASVPGSRIVSRATSPTSRRTSPPRSTTPTPTLGGVASPNFFVDDVKKTNDSMNQEVVRLRVQVENLTRKAQLQEVELERTTKQLKEAIAIAGEETAKCKAAKEVIKSLTAQRAIGFIEGQPTLRAFKVDIPLQVNNIVVGKQAIHSCIPLVSSSIDAQRTTEGELVKEQRRVDQANVHASRLKDMAERLPGGAARGNSKLPSLVAPFSTSSVSSVFSIAAVDQMSSILSSNELDSDCGSNGAVTNGPSSAVGHHRNKMGGQSEITSKGSKLPAAENECEYVEQDEPGVYITLTSLPGGVKDLKRVRFSRKRFSETEAGRWWAANRDRVYERYNVGMVDNRSAVDVGNE